MLKVRCFKDLNVQVGIYQNLHVRVTCTSHTQELQKTALELKHPWKSHYNSKILWRIWKSQSIIYFIGIFSFTFLSISSVSPSHKKNQMHEIREGVTSSEVLPAKKKGNSSVVEQSLNMISFSHPKVRKEGFKLEQAQRSSLDGWKNWESIGHGETKTPCFLNISHPRLCGIIWLLYNMRVPVRHGKDA